MALRPQRPRRRRADVLRVLLEASAPGERQTRLVSTLVHCGRPIFMVTIDNEYRKGVHWLETLRLRRVKTLEGGYKARRVRPELETLGCDTSSVELRTFPARIRRNDEDCPEKICGQPRVCLIAFRITAANLSSQRYIVHYHPAHQPCRAHHRRYLAFPRHGFPGSHLPTGASS